MAFPTAHVNGETWNGAAVTSLENRAAAYVDRMATAHLTPSGGDDSAAMVSALTSFAPFASPVIVMSPGTFLWNTSVPRILRNTPTRVIGAGVDHTIIKLSSSAPRFLDCPYVADYDTYQGLEISDLTVDCNNVRLASNAHVVVGNLISGDFSRRVNVNDVAVRRVKTINVPNRLVLGGAIRHSVGFGSLHVSSGEATQTTLTNIVCTDVNFNGGDVGFAVLGLSKTGGVTSVNVFMDRNGVDGFYHDCGPTPVASLSGNAANIQIGGYAFGERVFIKRMVGKNSQDIGIEIDGQMSADFEDCEIVDALNAGFGSYNFQQPRDPYSQVHTYHKCRVRMVNLDGLTGGTFLGWEVGSPNTPASGWFGTVVLNDVVYDSAAPNWQSNGVVVACLGAGLRRLVLGPMVINIPSINQTLTQNSGASMIFINPTSSVPCSIEGNGPINARIAGTTNLNGFTFTARPFFVQGQPNADITLDVHNYRPDYNMAGTADGFTYLSLFGPAVQYTTTKTGNTSGTTPLITGLSTLTSNLTVGQLVTGATVAADTYIQSIDSTSQVTLTKTPSAGSGTTFTFTQCPTFRGEFNYQVAGFSGGDGHPYGAQIQNSQGASATYAPQVLLDPEISFPFCDARKLPNPFSAGVESGREVVGQPQSSTNGTGQYGFLCPGLKIAGNSPPVPRAVGLITGSNPYNWANLQFGRRVKFWLTGTGTINSIGVTRRKDTSAIIIPGQTGYGPYDLDHGDVLSIAYVAGAALTLNVLPSHTS